MAVGKYFGDKINSLKDGFDMGFERKLRMKSLSQFAWLGKMMVSSAQLGTRRKRSVDNVLKSVLVTFNQGVFKGHQDVYPEVSVYNCLKSKTGKMIWRPSKPEWDYQRKAHREELSKKDILRESNN